MNERILIVDDDPNIRALIAITLKRAGFRTESVQDGAAAMARLRQETFDLVVLDLMMPRMSGWQLLQLLRIERKERLPRIIVVTAAPPRNAEEMDVADVVLSKPFDVQDLVKAAQDCLATA